MSFLLTFLNRFTHYTAVYISYLPHPSQLYGPSDTLHYIAITVHYHICKSQISSLRKEVWLCSIVTILRVKWS
jgi:hypothetical protein